MVSGKVQIRKKTIIKIRVAKAKESHKLIAMVKASSGGAVISLSASVMAKK